MKLLKKIEDKKIPKDTSKLVTREASRALIFDKNYQIPILFISKYKFHKLPGGGIEKGENRLKALEREIKEETGCKMKVVGEVGKVLEFRSKWNLKQISYCYIGQIISKGKPKFTKNEIASGSKIIWTTIDDAIFKIKSDKPLSYEGIFVQKRDLILLKKAKKELIKQKLIK